MSIEKNITRIFEEIESSKKSINEILSGSDELFGGSPVRIPRDGAHAGQSGWASGNAWDIAGSIGTPVYALASGVAVTFRDYGDKVIATDGKKLFGQSFTVDSDGDLPSVYYTHLYGSSIRKGSRVECGELLGYIMDFPGSSYDHVHIGVENGNIRQFLNDDGTLRCAAGQDITGSLVTGGALAAAGGVGALAAMSSGDSDETDSTQSDEFQFLSGYAPKRSDEFEFLTGKLPSASKEKKVSENIERIKKML